MERPGWKFVIQGALLRPFLSARDRRLNRRCAGAEKRLLIVRHAAEKPYFYLDLLIWLDENLPEVRPLFELHLLPAQVRDWSRYVLHIPWLQDPVQSWSSIAYEQARRLTRECDRRGIPVINRVESLANCTRCEAAGRIAAAGLRTPRMVRIQDGGEFRRTGCGLPLPLFVREDFGHGMRLIRVDTADELRAVPLELFRRPVATELIDVRSPDGLFRRYRHVTAGRLGVPHQMYISDHWISNVGEPTLTDRTRGEELEHCAGAQPRRELFEQARRALGLDLVAFDFGLDRDGQPIVWEANPYPFIGKIRPPAKLMYRNGLVRRTYAAVIHMYLDRAGLPIPDRLRDLLARIPGVWESPD